MSDRDAGLDMDEEMGEHVRLLIEHNVAAGMAPEEARRAALVAFGSFDATQEACRDQSRLAWLADVGQDVRFGARMLCKTPGFAIAVVLTLALGIGANTAIFSVVDAIMLRPLPYPESQRLVRIGEVFSDSFETVNYRNFLDWKAQQDVFEELGLWRDSAQNLTGGGEPLRLDAVEMSADVFRALRTAPLLGHLFGASDDQPGAAPVAILSHSFWQSRFGADPGIVGRAIDLNGRPFIVVGVMPPGFIFGKPTDLWIPTGLFSADWRRRDMRVGHRGLARLKSGVSLEQARAAMQTIAGRLEKAYPRTNADVRVGVDFLLDSQVRNLRVALWVLLAAAGVVLLIACANVAALLLARVLTRQREMAVRAALGASRWRMARQVLTESLLLSCGGAGLGFLLAHGALRFVVAAAVASEIPRAHEIALDGRVLLFCLALALLTGLVFGLLPAWLGSRRDLQPTLTDSACGPATTRSRIRQGLSVAQVALTLVLLIAAGLLLKSFQHLQQVNAGFADQGVLTFRLNLPVRKYQTKTQQIVFFRELVERLRTLPGVKAASASSQVPLDDNSWGTSFTIEGQPKPPPHLRFELELHMVEPDYFRVLGIRMLRGRSFNRQDQDELTLSSSDGQKQKGPLLPNVVLIDEQSAQRHWPGQEPIGQRIEFGSGAIVTVVGVVARVKLDQLGEAPTTKLHAYVPYAQMGGGDMTIVIKTALAPQALIPAARAQVQAIDPDQPIYAIRTMTEMKESSVAPQRLNLLLIGAFATLALVLAVVGLYGLLAYGVAQRRREIGVRVALGAGRGQVVGLVVRQGVLLAALGVALGLCGAIAVSSGLRSLLFEVAPLDLATFAGAPALLLVVALVASYLPARRAAALDPMTVLKHE